uniref:Integrase, catalytic region, zinc finger, CCHC-type, peptidase aspartic, catalytic n=1 Tax=Tanacetum cinerariifolium TaxID=118510 RepID=A0A6L2MCC8_TANCI|nr:hypothetical protein [Tanacetum cinerariifolium]
MCLVDSMNDVNVRLKSKSKRNKKRKSWKPTGKVFTDVGFKWKPTERFFTMVGNSCPLTRITLKKIMHLKETTPKSAETPKPEIKVYSRRPKQILSVSLSKKAKIVESKIANNLEPTHLWGSNLQMFHLLLLLSMIGCPDRPFAYGLQMFKTYDREPLSAHELLPVAAAPRVVEIADSPVSTSIDQDAPSSSIPSTQDQEHSLIIYQGVEESPETPLFNDDPLHEFLHEDSTSQGSSSNVRPSHTLFELIGIWNKDHLIVNMIGNPSRSVSTKKQLKINAMWCYFDAFLTSVEPKNFK